MSAQIYDFEVEKVKREEPLSEKALNRILMDIGVMDTSDIKEKEDE